MIFTNVILVINIEKFDKIIEFLKELIESVSMK